MGLGGAAAGASARARAGDAGARIPRGRAARSAHRPAHGGRKIPTNRRRDIGRAWAATRTGSCPQRYQPSNVLVNLKTGQVWLTGFGIASPFPRERQSPEPPEFIEGTLPYMAPEQTGRMNRSIDSRSDLYSLGVTLYQVLTGSLPFTASDPMEWVHCHIARKPATPTSGRNMSRLPSLPSS